MNLLIMLLELLWGGSSRRVLLQPVSAGAVRNRRGLSASTFERAVPLEQSWLSVVGWLTWNPCMRRLFAPGLAESIPERVRVVSCRERYPCAPMRQT